MPIRYKQKDNVGWVTLSRPGARNAWGQDFYEGLDKYFDEMEDDDAIRCAVITGDDTAGAFSAGANLKEPNTHKSASPAAIIKEISEKKRSFAI